MKKLLIIILAVLGASHAHAQKLNQDTLAKYSKKTEQVKVFKKSNNGYSSQCHTNCEIQSNKQYLH